MLDRPQDTDTSAAPFSAFDTRQKGKSSLRNAIESAHRLPETECVPPLIEAARMDKDLAGRIHARAAKLAKGIRDRGADGPVEALMQEYSLSSDEGIALMRMAEALLRIPDAATRDALIRDKFAGANWLAHVGGKRPLSVSLAGVGLKISSAVLGVEKTADEHRHALRRVISKSGAPIIRKSVELVMKLMGERFVRGQTIEEALKRSEPQIAKGYCYSYDMLGEAAMTAQDAARYYKDYENAIHAIGASAKGASPYDRPGISIKLSALHPRYRRAQYDRVMRELLPRVISLCALAKTYDMGINIDAEEAERLDISLDILEAISLAPELENWNGIGFVVQAYSKRCLPVIDFIIDLGKRAKRRIMVRLVKGAYWDSEIKIAQVEGLPGYPVFTRKIYSDVSYIAAAKKMLSAPEAIFPQFASHNAQTAASIFELAGSDYARDKFEFQCLHGMGESLYDQIVGDGADNRPCRIYAPVGSHETLLAYLVRRLLENGANSSFINQVQNDALSLEELIIDPAEAAAKIFPAGAPHPGVLLPKDILGKGRKNSAGCDLSNEQDLAALQDALAQSAAQDWRSEPLLGSGMGTGTKRNVVNPGAISDVVGTVTEADAQTIENAFKQARSGAKAWAETSPAERGEALIRAADLMEERMPVLIGLVMREAGKSAANAIAEAREAIDFLRYYGGQVSDQFSKNDLPLGTIVCISPWNFPLAIFTGQVAAALAAGNAVIAKPAEETPLIAAQSIAILREAGVPAEVVQLMPGDGSVGAQLVGHNDVCGVMFTGSTAVAKLINKQLSDRSLDDGRTIPLIAETGGQNAMIVDSTALSEQVVQDVVASAFDSAGQRCSALRLLCLQEDIAEQTLDMLINAMRELRIANTTQLRTDVGPVITAEAQTNIVSYIDARRKGGFRITSADLDANTARHGHFVPPTIIELNSPDDMGEEVFGPVLHVISYKRDELDRLISHINELGYGLTFGLHTRIDFEMDHVAQSAEVGNVYVNRNIIGAVVGVQPFGGHGLSGTGPKAGGPLYLRRLLRHSESAPDVAALAPTNADLSAYAKWLDQHAYHDIAKHIQAYGARSCLGVSTQFPSPVGEDDKYEVLPRGTVLLIAQSVDGLLLQIGAALATGNHMVALLNEKTRAIYDGLPAFVQNRLVNITEGALDTIDICGALIEGDQHMRASISSKLAARDGAIIPVQHIDSSALAKGRQDYALEMLVIEKSISINTTAAGGNAALLAKI